MRIKVLVPGAEFLSTAGARIRYQRIAPHLERLGHTIGLQVIDSLQLRPKPDCDVVLISKCYDARSVLVAAELGAQGILTGADFFDDYYTQVTDSRLMHMRGWFRTISPYLSFALCSTPVMREALFHLAPSLPCHMMNDPFESFDPGMIAERIEHKLRRVQSSGVLEMGWFGIGDNPYFPVGLTDLVAQAGCLAELRELGLSPRLSIITNRRAMTVEKLELLSGLPVPWRLEEWSEDAERRLIERSYACFLPVNAQPFSVAKSLNRAVTALTGGAQVLVSGYPLYEVFSEFLYHDAGDLVSDVRAGRSRLGRSTLGRFSDTLHRHADPEREVAGLAEFLDRLAKPGSGQGPKAIAIIHGRSVPAVIHKFAQKNGHLSVAGFRNMPDLNWDVQPVIDPDSGLPAVQLSPRAMQLLRSHLADAARLGQTASGRPCHLLPLPDGFPPPPAANSAPDSEAAALASYSADMENIRRLLAHLFDGITMIPSETTSPFVAGCRRSAA